MTPQGLAMLKEDEGCELTAYPDPLSGGEPYTIGYGHARGVCPGDRITQAQADALLVDDVERAAKGLIAALPWTVDLDGPRNDVLVNMCYNLGVGRLLGFRNTLAAVQAGDWKGAAAAMLNSAWAKQVKGRAYRLAHIMETGEWPT